MRALIFLAIINSEFGFPFLPLLVYKNILEMVNVWLIIRKLVIINQAPTPNSVSTVIVIKILPGQI